MTHIHEHSSRDCPDLPSLGMYIRNCNAISNNSNAFKLMMFLGRTKYKAQTMNQIHIRGITQFFAP